MWWYAVRRFDPAGLLAGLLFGTVSGVYFASGFGGGLPFPAAWLVAGLLIGLGVIGIVRTVFRRRDPAQ
jgi:hypothetical protein